MSDSFCVFKVKSVYNLTTFLDLMQKQPIAWIVVNYYINNSHLGYLRGPYDHSGKTPES